ncbi:MAG: tRNA 2-selenouridine(34) synthase MnmH [Bacteroidales bacterium]|nr:tRNA 2-selenouridine(34) synthase MnmH [Bacteroidales bacterium]
MIHPVDIAEFKRLRKSLPAVDVRSPGEFTVGHIPDAFNLPLFDDEERKAVGITYKQQGREPAILKGLDLVGCKLSGFVKQARKIAPGRKLLLHCWRGGMRSEGMAWLLSTAGFEVNVLKGGYKAYRRFNSRFWEKASKMIILSGKTGSGKTEILHVLQHLGHQVLDLERFAHHKGSAFGAIGEVDQPNSEQFENDLAEVWQLFDFQKPIWIEDESRMIGRVFIPEILHFKMSKASVISLEMPKKLRIERLIDDYAKYPKPLLIHSIEKISRRLGGQNMKTAVNAIGQDDFGTAIDIVLDYYDKAYCYDLTKKVKDKTFTVPVQTADAEANAREVIDFCNKYQLI